MTQLLRETPETRRTSGAAGSRLRTPKVDISPVIRLEAGAPPNGNDDPHGGHLRHVFQLLERQNLHGSAGRLGLHVHRLTKPERIRHVFFQALCRPSEIPSFYHVNQ